MPPYWASKDMAPQDQGSHQNAVIIEPIGAFFVSIMNNKVIHQILISLSILQGLTWINNNLNELKTCLNEKT